MNKKVLKAVDFFCCSGGVTYGFKQAGIKVLGGIDIEGAYKETYEKNNRGSRFIQADVSKLLPQYLEAELGIKRRMDDLIFVGCSPCQYYTTIQTNKTKSSKGKLLLEEFKRFVDYFRPGFLFIENVPGLETKTESPLSRFKEQIKKMGYTFDEKILNASDYDVPQNRKRYVLIATRLHVKIEIPLPTQKPKISVRQVIGDLPKIAAGHKDNNIEKHWSGKLGNINLRRLKETPHNGGTRLSWKDNKELQLKCYEGKDSTFTDVYGRLYWDLPSPTITTKFYSISNGRFGHPEQDRALSLKEGALLQSFPPSYSFHSESMVVTARMIGNAVPPKLAQAIGNKLVKIFQA